MAAAGDSASLPRPASTKWVGTALRMENSRCPWPLIAATAAVYVVVNLTLVANAAWH
jgi:hypothetical protein